jgi:hypothetical protein
MSAYRPFHDARHLVGILTECSQACRRITDPSNGVVLFSYPPKFLQLLNDCAATCDLAIILIERKSPIVSEFLELCEEFSLECASECSSYNTTLCEQCTKACESAAKVCLQFIVRKETA